MAHLQLPPRSAIPYRVAHNSKSEYSSCKAKLKEEQNMVKVVVLLSPTQRTKLLQIPESFAERDIVRYYSLSAEDLMVIGQHRRAPKPLPGAAAGGTGAVDRARGPCAGAVGPSRTAHGAQHG